MKKGEIFLILFVYWVLIVIAGCASPVGPAYTGGTEFHDSILFKLLLVSIPVTAFMFYTQANDAVEFGDMIVFSVIIVFFTFLIGGLFSGADPQEIQDQHFGWAFTIISSVSGIILGIIMGIIRNFF